MAVVASLQQGMVCVMFDVMYGLPHSASLLQSVLCNNYCCQGHIMSTQRIENAEIALLSLQHFGPVCSPQTARLGHPNPYSALP